LLGWALRLTGFDEERAEDLVHDAFVHFSTARPDLNAILPNLEGYLYTMLRNLNLSNLRRATRQRARQVALSDSSLAEFESLEAGLRAASENAQLQVQEQLHQICLYACRRRETSKAGSVLILRFFHGYYPSEIALVCRTSRGAVDEWMRVARSEVKSFLASPSRSKEKSFRPELNGVGFGSSNAEFVRELREAIFKLKTSDCLSVEKLEELYVSERAASGIDAPSLGHIVSCRRCLDEVNRLLRVPSLAERNPAQMLGPETRRRGNSGNDRDEPSDDNPDDDSNSGAPGVEELVRKSERRLRDVLEHKPKELRICVNGREVEAFAVGSEVTRRRLEIGDEEGALGFVEIFSEREVRLLFCNVEALPSATVQRTRVELSDGRTLELIVDATAHRAPELQVSYHDPTFAEQAVLSAIRETNEQQAKARREGTWREMLRRLPNGLSAALRRHASLPLWMRPGAALAAVLLLATAIALLLFLLKAPVPRVSAAELLRKSAAAETHVAQQQPDSILFRAFRLEEVDAESGKTVAVRRVEIWKSTSNAASARRLFDEREQLIAGEWQSGAGERKIYRLKSAETKLSAATEGAWADAPNVDEFWLLEPSAQIFSSLVGHGDEARVDESRAAYVLRFQNGDERGEAGLLRASLTLNKSDLSPEAMSLVVRRGGALREHRFTVTNSERRAARDVAPSVFEPDAALLDGGEVSVEMRAKVDETLSPLATDAGAHAAAPRPPTATAAPASVELEIEALRLLSQAGADLGEQLSVSRTPEGKLLIKAVVETSERKQALVGSLAPVANNPSVVVEILTATEALEKQRGQRASARLELPEAESQAVEIPLATELRRHFSRGGAVPDEQVETQATRFAARAVERSSQVLQHAWAIKRLASRFSERELAGLSDEARAKWMSLIARHARSLRQQAALQRQELAPIFSGGQSSDDGASPAQITGEKELVRAADLLVELCTAEHRATRAAFTISPAGSREAVAKVARMQSSLRKIEMLAASILDAPQK
jgi:RNA polymerase sigma factor (sigma-70 family)